MKIPFLKNKEGFTLVELLIAVGLFTVIAFIAIGAILSVFDAHKRAQSSKTVIDNLNLSLEDMVRMIRFGTTYNCDPLNPSYPPSQVHDCDDLYAGSPIMSIQFPGMGPIMYQWNNNAIERSDDGGATFAPITAPDVVIEHLSFRVSGTSEIDIHQPYVVISVGGYVGNKPTRQSRFWISTTVSQRQLDVN